MTTENPPAPAIGSPEWARALPPSAHTRSDITFGGTHVWTDDKGNIKGRIDLGDVDLTFRTPAQVRDLIGRLAGLAGEMDAEIMRQQRPPSAACAATFHSAANCPDARHREPKACSRCGATDTPLVPVNDEGGLRCNESHRCAERVAARDDLRPDDLTECEACHITAPRREMKPFTIPGKPGLRWVCADLLACSDRPKAARDAEAAQVAT